MGVIPRIVKLAKCAKAARYALFAISLLTPICLMFCQQIRSYAQWYWNIFNIINLVGCSHQSHKSFTKFCSYKFSQFTLQCSCIMSTCLYECMCTFVCVCWIVSARKALKLLFVLTYLLERTYLPRKELEIKIFEDAEKFTCICTGQTSTLCFADSNKKDTLLIVCRSGRIH